MFEKEIQQYKNEVDQLMYTIMHEDLESEDTRSSLPKIPTGDSDEFSSAGEPRPISASTPALLPSPTLAGDILAIAQGPQQHSTSTPHLALHTSLQPEAADEPRSAGVTLTVTKQDKKETPPSPEAVSPQALTPPPPTESSPTAKPRRRGSGGGKDRSNSASPTDSIRRKMLADSWSKRERDEANRRELNYKKKLQASWIANARVKFDLLEKERLLKIAEREIEDLKRRLREREEGL